MHLRRLRVIVHRQAIAEKKVAVRMDPALMGIVESIMEIPLKMQETWRQDFGGLALVLILRTVGVRAKSRVEGVHSLIGCLKFWSKWLVAAAERLGKWRGERCDLRLKRKGEGVIV
jgi:hypothetical protein